MLKTVERIFVKLIKHIIDINEIESGFMPGPLDAIFILRELQVDWLVKKMDLYYASLEFCFVGFKETISRRRVRLGLCGLCVGMLEGPQ